MELNKDDLERIIDEHQEDMDKIHKKTENSFIKWAKKVKEFFTHPKNTAIVILAVMLVSCFYWIATVENNPQIKKVIQTVVEKVKPDNNLMCVNLEELKVTKVRETQSRLTGKDLFVVYREDKNQNLFITMFEEVENLQHNADVYETYVEEQKKKVLADTEEKPND